MDIGMPLLAIGWFLFGVCLYVFCTVSYVVKFKFYMDRLHTFNPMLVVNKYTRTQAILILVLCLVLACVVTVGLWIGNLWIIGLAVLLHANEAKRGAVDYMKVGNYWESIKHQLINATILGYIGSYLLLSKFSATIPAWVKETLEFWK